ncbi:MAG: hypothetical protein ACJ76Y_30335 [Thermoanaerobaculia bacterium]
MLILEIPLLAADQTPEEAIDRMNAMDTRVAGVRFSSGELRLIRNAEVLRGWQKETLTLADLGMGEYIDPLPEISGGPETQLDALQQALDAAGTNYGIAEDIDLLGADRLSVWVGSRHEILIHSQQRLWRCRNPKKPHSGTIPPDVCPPICPQCGWVVKCG